MGSKTKEVADKAKVDSNILLTAFAKTLTSIDLRIAAIEEMLKEKIKQGNGRGPLSTRNMTAEDAKKIMIGDMKSCKIKECASTLGLSYGQIYSARNGYTFKSEYALRVAEEKAIAKAEKK